MSRENSFRTDQEPAVASRPQEAAADYDSELENETLSLCDFSLYSHEFLASSRKGRSTPSSIIDEVVRCRKGYRPVEFSLSLSSATEKNSRRRSIIIRPYGRRDPALERERKLKKRRHMFYFKWKQLRLFRSKHMNPYQRLKVNHSDSSYCRKLTAAQPCGGVKRCRWRHLLVLGSSARYPMEMELQDIKMRQNRRSMSVDYSNGSSDQKRNNGRSWVLWRLLTTLSCNGGRLHPPSPWKKKKKKK